MAKRTKTYQRIPDPARKLELQAAERRRRNARRLWRVGLPAGLALVAIVAAVVVSLSHHSGPTPPKPVSAVGQNVKACLLTDSGQKQADVAFAGLRSAAGQSGNVNAQQLTVPAASTDASPLLAGLIQQHCAVVVVLGPLSVMAAEGAATNAPAQAQPATLIAIADSAKPGKHLDVLPLTGLTAAEVGERVTDVLK
jgi:hypothetical protein